MDAARALLMQVNASQTQTQAQTQTQTLMQTQTHTQTQTQTQAQAQTQILSGSTTSEGFRSLSAVGLPATAGAAAAIADPNAESAALATSRSTVMSSMASAGRLSLLALAARISSLTAAGAAATAGTAGMIATATPPLPLTCNAVPTDHLPPLLSCPPSFVSVVQLRQDQLQHQRFCPRLCRTLPSPASVGRRQARDRTRLPALRFIGHPHAWHASSF
jgi:hypothetical protein